MHALALGIAWGLLGLDVGWRPAAGGGMEYIIQIAPHELELFKQHGIEGDIPPQVKDIRMYRVVVGNDVLPRQDPPPEASNLATKASSSAASPMLFPPLAGQTKAYNPFASLSSLVSRYPFGQLTADSTRLDSSRPNSTRPDSSRSDSTRPDSSKDAPRGKDSSVERWWEDGPTKVQRPTVRGAAEKTQAPPKEIPEPWLPFTVVVLALFGSLGGNLYMGWITWETRAKYHALVRRLRNRANRLGREARYETDDD